MWRTWKLPMTVFTVLAILAAGIGIGAGIRGAFANNGSGVIYACKGDRSGSIRIVTKTAQCQRGETPIIWNVQGPAGSAGAAELSWRGAWSAATTYVASDAVEYQRSAYIAVAPSQGQTPGTGGAWQLLAQGSDAAQSRTIGGYVLADGTIVSGAGFSVAVDTYDDFGFEITFYEISFPAGIWSNGFAPTSNMVDACSFGSTLMRGITSNPDGSGSFILEDPCGDPFDFTFIATGAP
jgi:hypothetical protein